LQDLTNILRVYHQAFFNQIFCSSGENLLGKYSTVSTYHTTGHFLMKNKNVYKLAINSNNSKSYARM